MLDMFRTEFLILLQPYACVIFKAFHPNKQHLLGM